MTGAPRPVNVAYVMNAPKIGGGNRVLLTIIETLDRTEYRPMLVTPAPGPLVEWAASHNVPCFIVPGDQTDRRALLSRAWRLVQLFREQQVHIVHAAAETCYRAVGLAGGLTGAIRVCHLGCPPAPGTLPWAFRWAPEAVIGCYMAQAEAVREEVYQVRRDCRVVGIPNSIDFTCETEGRAPAKDWRFGGRSVVAIVGHLSANKGFPTFIRAAATLRSKVDGCVFLVVGDEMNPCGYRAELEELAGRLGVSDCVHFLGWQPNVREILPSVDVLALPSIKEGLPLAVLEAMAYGRPVVATAVGGMPEAVVDGVNGLLVPPENPESLAIAIARILSDPALAARMGAAGRARIKEHFSRAVFAAKVNGLYRDLIDERADSMTRNFARRTA